MRMQQYIEIKFLPLELSNTVQASMDRSFYSISWLVGTIQCPQWMIQTSFGQGIAPLALLIWFFGCAPCTYAYTQQRFVLAINFGNFPLKCKYSNLHKCHTSALEKCLRFCVNICVYVSHCDCNQNEFRFVRAGENASTEMAQGNKATKNKIPMKFKTNQLDFDSNVFSMHLLWLHKTTTVENRKVSLCARKPIFAFRN